MAESDEIQGRTLPLPCVVRDAPSGSAMRARELRALDEAVR